MRVVLVTPDVGDNSTGRAYCLWLLAEALGWESVTLAYGEPPVWPPVAGSRFADTIETLPSDRPAAERMIRSFAEQSDVVLAVKPVQSSFGFCLGAWDQKPFPLVLDIDDPDLEVVLGNRTPNGVERPSGWSGPGSCPGPRPSSDGYAPSPGSSATLSSNVSTGAHCCPTSDRPLHNPSLRAEAGTVAGYGSSSSERTGSTKASTCFDRRCGAWRRRATP
jgi:hypothetical protein